MKKQKLLSFVLVNILLLAGCAGRTDAQNNISSEPASRDIQIMPSEIPNPEINTPETLSPEKLTPETITPETITPNSSSTEIDSTTEHSFLGTVIEETGSYMIVEPDENEEERQLSDRFTVSYPSEHPDYLYGKGRRVVVYYYETPSLRSDFEILTDDISTEGFREFELSVTPAEESGSKETALVSDGLYYYGISDVTISVDGQTMSLEEALESGRITLNALLTRANQDVNNGIAQGVFFDDGGSSLYQYEDYSIMKYHTLDGNRDMYIGNRDMDIRVCRQ